MPRLRDVFNVNFWAILALFALVFNIVPLEAQTPTPVTPGYQICSSASGSTQCSFQPLDLNHPLPVMLGGTNGVITGNAAGTTAAVVGTLAAATGKTTFICGFNVQAIGGTATVGPVTVAGLVGSSMVFQTDVNSATVGKTVASAAFTPCIPASATNTAITVTTTANGTASAVNVNSWGYQQ